MNFKLLKNLFFVFFLTLTLSACVNNNDDGTVTPTIDSPNEAIVIWWNLFEPIENVQPLITAFEEANPNIKIQYNQRGIKNGVEGYKQELDIALNDNDPLSTPDIFTIHNSWIYAYSNYINSAPTSIIDETYFEDLYPIIKSDVFRNNRVLGLPFNIDAIALIYNKDLLVSNSYTVPANNWIDLATMARNITKTDANRKITVAGFSGGDNATSEFSTEVLNLVMMQNGTPMTNSTGNQATFADTENINGIVPLDKSQEALTSYLNITNETWDSSLENDTAQFLNKKLAFYPAPSWRLIDILNYNDNYNLNLNIGTSLMPQLEEAGVFHWPTYWIQTVAKDSANSEASWKFLKFITEPNNLEILNNTVIENGRPFGILYPRISMQESVLSSQNGDLLKPFMNAFSLSKNWNIPNGVEVEKIFSDVLDGKTDLTSAQNQINNLY